MSHLLFLQQLRPVATAALTVVLLLVICTGGCRHAEDACKPCQMHRQPSFAVVRAELKEPLDEFMADYIVTCVLWSDVALETGKRVFVYCRDGGTISSQSQPPGGVREWPSDAVLALVVPNSPTDAGPRICTTITTRWEHWVAAASDQTVTAFAALCRERLLEAHVRESMLEQRDEDLRAEARRVGSSVELVVDADSDVADHAVFSIVVRPGHSSRQHLSLALAVWPSGRVVWSEKTRLGGAPYLQGHVPRERLLAFRQRLEAAGIFDGSAFGKGGACVLSGGSSCLGILWDRAHVVVRSSRDLYDHVDEDESPEFGKAWETLWAEVGRLIQSTKGTVLPDYEFQVLSYPVSSKQD